MDDLLAKGMALHRGGKFAEAEKVYQQLLQKEPGNARAMQLLGMVACQRGQLEAGAEWVRRAIEAAPGVAEYWMNLAEIQMRMGRHGEVAESLKKAVALDGKNAVAYYQLGVALTSEGKSQEAIEANEKALEIKPAFPEALNNLGLLLHTAGRHEEAAEQFKKALALKPDHAKAHGNLGQALWMMGRHGEALEAFSRAVKLAPGLAGAQTGLAFALQKMGRKQEAAAAFRKAAELNPGSTEIFREMGMVLSEIGQEQAGMEACRRAVALAPPPDARAADAQHILGVVLAAAAKTDPGKLSEAIAAYDAALALRPESQEWEFERAALRGERPAQAPDSFVKALFDDYAERFEEHLVKGLGYRVPWDLRAAVLGVARPGVERWNVLDLGCGTGLCGEVFRGEAQRMVGVDLSPKMVEIAGHRKMPKEMGGGRVYDEVFVGSVMEALAAGMEQYDLILATDVFVYVGSLEEVFPACVKSLKAGGLLAFSLEHHEGEGFALTSEKRFAHSIAYIRELARAAGLEEAFAERHVMRAGIVPGWLVVLRRPG